MIARAAERCPRAGNLRWLTGDLLDHTLPVTASDYDAVTAVSSLRRMPLEPALGRLAGCCVRAAS
jgi:hypothetical protein